MVQTQVHVGPKGQILIPKLLRDEYGFEPGKVVVLSEEEGRLAIERPKVDVVAVLNSIRKKRVEYKPDEWYEQELRERLQRAGIEVP